MKKDNLLKYVIAPYNVLSSIMALVIMGKDFWYPDPSEGLLTFILKIIIFFVFIVFLFTNSLFWFKKNEYYLFSLKYNFWIHVIQSMTIRVFGVIINFGVGAEILIYGIYKQGFSFGLEYKLWNYVLTLVYNHADKSTFVLGFNIISILIAVFFYRLILVQKSKKKQYNKEMV